MALSSCTLVAQSGEVIKKRGYYCRLLFGCEKGINGLKVEKENGFFYSLVL